MVIALSAWKRSGKDYTADLLVSAFKFKRLAFADILKDMVAEQYRIPRSSLDDQELKEKPLLNLPVNPQDEFSRMIADYMKLELKPGPGGQLFWTPRALAILEGSVKRSVNSKYWVEKALSQIGEDDLTVITDMRYKSEAQQIRDYANSIGQKCLLIRINRFDDSPSKDPSERDLDNYEGFDFVIENRGTLEEFENKVMNIVFNSL